MNFADEIAQHQYRYSSESIYSNIDQHAPEEKFLQYFDIHIILLLLQLVWGNLLRRSASRNHVAPIVG
jgi:hypothetical protein